MAEADSTTPERWLPVPGYEGVYSVSDQGRVRREVGPPRRMVRLLKPALKTTGYMAVTLCRPGRRQQTGMVSRLVLLAFVGEATAGHECCHKDGDPTNDRLDNLRWGTRKENMADRDRHGRTARGDTHYARRRPECLARGDRHGSRLHPERLARGTRCNLAKITEAAVLKIRERLAAGESQSSVARAEGVGRMVVRGIAHGKTWRHV